MAKEQKRDPLMSLNLTVSMLRQAKYRANRAKSALEKRRWYLEGLLEKTKNEMAEELNYISELDHAMSAISRNENGLISDRELENIINDL
jgi:hypothetical protein